MSVSVFGTSVLSRIAASVATIADIVIMPRSGSSTAGFRGSILTALVLLLGLAYLGTVLEWPVTEKVIHVTIVKQLAAQATTSASAPEMAEKLTAVYTKVVPVIGLVMLVLQQLAGAALISLAVLMLNGRASYEKMLYIFVHTSVPTVGLSLLAAGAIHLVRGPAAYDSSLSMLLSIPSAAWLATLPPPAEIAIAALNPFTVWQVIILTAWIGHAARLSTARALIAACVPLVVFTAIASMYASGS